MTYINFKPWTRATEELSWGVQSVLYNTLALAAEGKIRLSYGQDYVDGVPCLINSAGQMLKSGEAKEYLSKTFVT